MCGICGFVGDPDPERLDGMLRRLEHRGPDEEGRVETTRISLGIRRLRVIDPAGGRQPVANETGTVLVVFNGEIYNYRSLREELIQKGHRFRTRSDTEVLVHLYEEEGEEGVRRLRGMFAYALWDEARQRLVLVRDRLGVKPLYYTLTRAGRALLFASELPALLAGLPSSAVRPAAVAEYLTRLYVPGPRTLFEGVVQLPPGHYLTLQDGRVEVRSYYALPPPAAPPFDTEGVEERLLDRLRETVLAHLVSDVPVGLFLSGGLDSASILAMMRAATSAPIRTFSIGYESGADRSYDELADARHLARHFDTEHTEERLRPDAVKLLGEIVAAMGEPFADASAIPTYLVARLARRSVTVALSGIGGDELFGGYPRYLGLRWAARYAAVPYPVRGWLARHVAARLPERSTSRNRIGRLKRFLQHGEASVAQQYSRWMAFVPPEWGEAAFTPELRHESRADPGPPFESLFERWPSPDPADRAMVLDLQTYLPDDLLRMGDRLSMAHSLELRVPFCDHLLLELACAVPAHARFRGQQLKGLLRTALRTIVPRAVLQHPKRGFQVPLARWLREDLREMVADLLSPSAVRRRGYVQPQYVDWLIREHRGGRNLADPLYALLVLELWHRACECR